MIASTLQLPAEWASQDAVLLAWPHAGTDWAERLNDVERSYVALAAAITRFEHVVICVADVDVRARAAANLAEHRVDTGHVRFVEVAYDDTWLRDSGPITLVDDDGAPQCLLDFRFTGWGGKFAAERDDRLVAELHARGLFGTLPRRRVDFPLEGGAIDSDGRGTVMSTWRCLRQRLPELDRTSLIAELKRVLEVDSVHLLEHGWLEGDDTDAHIDTLARFAPDGAIVHQTCDDPGDSHHAELQRMRDELAELRRPDGTAYRLHPLPWARPITDQGRRLAASYANYLVINDAVLVPVYGDPADDPAADVIAAAHPGRTTIQIPCRPLIWQNGSLHCLTMQLPRGTLAA